MIHLKKKHTKFDALAFSKAIMGKDTEVEIDPTRHEAKNFLNILEAAVQTEIIGYLEVEEIKGNLFFSRVNTIPVYDQQKQQYRALPRGVKLGFPDLFILKDGRSIFVELKSSTGDQGKAQKRVEQGVIPHGGEYYIVRTLKFLKEILDKQKPS